MERMCYHNYPTKIYPTFPPYVQSLIINYIGGNHLGMTSKTMVRGIESRISWNSGDINFTIYY